MKTVFRILLPLLIISTLLALTTCAPDTYDNAALNISINNSSARAAALAVSIPLEEINHQIILTGPTGTVLTYNISGSGNLSASVTAGTWRIDVTGYYGEELYSQGTASVAVKAGQSNSVSVLMTVVWQEGGFIPPPGSNLPQLPGTAYIDGDKYWFPLVSGPDPNKIYAYYYDPAWDSTDPTVAVSPMDGYIVQWYVGSQLVKTDTDANVVRFIGFPGMPVTYSKLNGSFFEVTEEYWNRDVFAIVSHNDYYGTKSNSQRICKAVDGFEWIVFSGTPGGGSGFEWEGNSFILIDPSYAIPTSPIGDNASLDPTPFNGYLDGNGKTIGLANITPTVTKYAGLFAHIGPRGTVMNLRLIMSMAATSTGDCYAGGVAGLNEGTIMDIASVATSTPPPFSGLSTSGDSYAGGIAGHNKGIIKNCSVSHEGGIGNMPPSPPLNFTSYAGGIAGLNEGEISFCWVFLGGSAVIMASDSAGGIAGINSKNIEHCVALRGRIQQAYGTNVGRIWGSGNGTGRANWANDDNDDPSTSMLPLITGIPVFPDLVPIAPTDDRTDSKHGKGVFYDDGGPVYTSDDASLQTWWMYTAGWASVWIPPTFLNGLTWWAVSPEKPWKWQTISIPTAPFYPLLF